MITKREFLRSTALASLSLYVSPLAATADDKPGFFKAKDIAESGFVYGLPLIMAYGALYEFAIDKTSDQYKGPLNKLINESRVFTYKDTAVVTPNSDTPYSFVWMDLRAEPYVFSFPAFDPKRYYSLQLTDLNTYNFGYVGSRATGHEAGSYMIVSPSWNGPTPPGIKKVFRSTTDIALGLIRTQLFNAADIDNVKALQAQYIGETLSSFLKQPPPPPAPALDFPKFEKDLVKTEFFEYLDFVLKLTPVSKFDKDIRDQLAKIGIGPGTAYNFKDSTLVDKAEVLIGMKQGKTKVDDSVKNFGKNVNGWRVGSAFGDEAFFSGNWLLRATAAQAGIFGNDAVEAMYPMAKIDVTGKPLDTSNTNYTLTFPAGQLPPVNAFWSVTMYDGKTQLLIKNPIDRYLINSPMMPELKLGPDGSLTLYIQKDKPDGDKAANWLPAPDGPAYIVMRLYWPKKKPPSILPPGEGTWQPPGITAAS